MWRLSWSATKLTWEIIYDKFQLKRDTICPKTITFSSMRPVPRPTHLSKNHSMILYFSVFNQSITILLRKKINNYIINSSPKLLNVIIIFIMFLNERLLSSHSFYFYIILYFIYILYLYILNLININWVFYCHHFIQNQ